MASNQNTTATPQALAFQALLRRCRGQGSAGLLSCLQQAQAITGWLDPNTCTAISESLDVPLSQIHGVIEFYSLLYNEPVAPRIVRVCNDIPCYLAGSEAVIQACAHHVGVDPDGGTSPDGGVTLEIHPCLGRCEQAPFLMIDDEAYGHVQPDQISELLAGDT